MFAWLKRLSFTGLVGLALAIVGTAIGVEKLLGTLILAAGVLCITPLLVFAYVLTILHWKHRYIGPHSTLWGVLLLIETTGWFKLIYIFRHILPDAKSSGRYRKIAA